MRIAEPQKAVRGLKFGFRLYWNCSIFVAEHSAYYLRGCRATDLRLCFPICKCRFISVNHYCIRMARQLNCVKVYICVSECLETYFAVEVTE